MSPRFPCIPSMMLWNLFLQRGGEEEVQEEEEAQPQKKVKLNYGSKATLSSRAI